MSDFTEYKKKLLHDLMLKHERDVWNYAFSICKRQEVADDITQDVFIRAYHKINSFQGNSSIKTWLLVITRNLVADYRKSAFFRKVTLIDTLFENGSHPSAEHEVLEKLITDEIWGMVMSLPLKLREVLVLHAHHQLTISEISNVLGITQSAVKSRLHRARSAVTNFYSKEGGVIDGRI